MVLASFQGMWYSGKWYQAGTRATMDSAHVVVPIVVDLVHPASVIDFGCGIGAWLRVFRDNGITDVMGMDGEWVRPKALLIDRDSFFAADLRQPITLARRFDLAISLEVAEHLPSECAGQFVQTLVRAAPAVLFSAAIPFQGGLRHCNEQWPAYWARLFRDCGYLCLDCIRERVWNDRRVEYWYSQNTFLFVVEQSIARYADLHTAGKQPGMPPPFVHPEAYVGLARHKFLFLQHLSLARERLASGRIRARSHESELFSRRSSAGQSAW